jgi:hypothetical protein
MHLVAMENVMLEFETGATLCFRALKGSGTRGRVLDARSDPRKRFVFVSSSW